MLGLLGEAEGAFASQVVVTTHSPHIMYERGFGPIRYFRRHVSDVEQTTQVLNLSNFQPSSGAKDRDFLQRYLKLTHCDLFFADAAILVEGNVERLLMPLMIEKAADRLRSAALCILEVGGAFGHRFKELIEFLGINTLIVTDIDSVTASERPTEGGEEDEDVEIDMPAAGAVPAVTLHGTMCLPGTAGAVTSNQTLIKWLPRMRAIDDLLDAPEPRKIEDIEGASPAKVRVAYPDLDGGRVGGRHGRDLRPHAGGVLRPGERPMVPVRRATPARAEAEDLPRGCMRACRRPPQEGHRQNFRQDQVRPPGTRPCDKREWKVPSYIGEGLIWLAEQVALEVRQEAEAVAEAVSATE